ncbi:MAG TPA: NADH-quinone oxidoreductase subunit H [Candidatus Limiplasma sp.]|nr:NADH-quinone oxidoreductase subunit H [Candidatus Limiplasma sp.]HRX09586.1 NADH-quinone oxidoreductase subunit H [Candidatus Limiplasma sp.]
MNMNQVFLGTLTGLIILVFAFFWQTTLSGVTRKIVARFHKRYGPKFYQEFRDIFKLLTKTGISHGWVYNFGVMMALGGIMGTAMFMPVMQFAAFPGLDNIFIYVYLFAVGMLGMAMSAVGSGNPLAGIGVMRALTQMVGYEVPFMVVVLAMVYGHGTASVSELAAVQQTAGLATWNIVKMPIGTLVGFICLLGMLGKKPFETFIAPAEIASGPMVEYGGKQLGMLMLLHEFSIFIEVSLFVNLFLGGAVTVVGYAIKYVGVFVLASLISQALGRFKIDQVIKYFYRWPIALALVQALIVIFLGWGV